MGFGTAGEASAEDVDGLLRRGSGSGEEVVPPSAAPRRALGSHVAPRGHPRRRDPRKTRRLCPRCGRASTRFVRRRARAPPCRRLWPARARAWGRSAPSPTTAARGSRAPAVSVAPVLDRGRSRFLTRRERRRAQPEHAPMPTAYPIPLRPPAPQTLIHAPVSAPPPVRTLQGPALARRRGRALPSHRSPSAAGQRGPLVCAPAAHGSRSGPGRVPKRSFVDRRDGSEDIEIPGGSPRRLGGWLVAIVLVAGAGVIGFAVAKPYLEARTTQRTASASALDPRAAQMLADGERALSTGDLEGANDAFTKASALAEKDPRVLLDVARLANARADVPWLRARILPSDASDDERATTAQLDELGARAKKAALDASGAAPDDASAILAKIDALRITGDTVTARALVSKVIQSASQPETAYALAALDLAEPEPLWPMVIERLRLATAREGEAGRARAALVYALARSGDAAGAKAELDKLAGLSRPYPLVGALRAFVAKVPEAKDAGGGSAHAVAGSEPGRPRRRSRARGAAGVAVGGGGGTISYSGANDPRFLLTQAESAKSSRDYERARALYSSALAQNPSDSEALAGLGDVDHDAARPRRRRRLLQARARREPRVSPRARRPGRRRVGVRRQGRSAEDLPRHHRPIPRRDLSGPHPAARRRLVGRSRAHAWRHGGPRERSVRGHRSEAASGRSPALGAPRGPSRSARSRFSEASDVTADRRRARHPARAPLLRAEVPRSR